MEFPVSVEGLPDDDDAKYPDKYEKLDYYSIHSPLFDKKFKLLYQKYALETALTLDKLPSEKFNSHLNKIENLIRSFDVK